MASVVRPRMATSTARWMSRSLTRVEGARGLVEDEDARVLEQDAGQGDALLLATRELVAALADDGLVAVRKLADAIVDGRQAGGGLDLPVRRLGPGVGQVLAQGGVEEVGLLRDEADDVAEAGEADAAHVAAVDLDGSLGHVVEARQEVGRRRLAGTGWPHERHQLPRLRLRSRCPRGRRAGRHRRPSQPPRRHAQRRCRAPRRHPCRRARRRRGRCHRHGSRHPPPARLPRGPAAGPSRDTRRRRGGTAHGRERRPDAASQRPGSSLISGCMSRYSKMRSNSARAPWTSTCTLSSCPRGKKRRLWRVVKATMSPMVGAFGSPWMTSIARQPVDERRHDREDGAHEHEEPAAHERLAQLQAAPGGRWRPGSDAPIPPAARTSWPAGCR